MRVGILGTGAIAGKHAQAYRNIGFQVVACSNRSPERGRAFAEQWQAEFVPNWQDLCRYPGIDFLDVCTYPDFRLEPLLLCAKRGLPLQVQKPIATTRATALAMIRAADAGGITLGVASQRRFDDATMFLRRAIAEGRLGRILEADAYVKWFRSEAYYARPGKGSWEVEGGGALINQAIHQIDLLLYLNGPVTGVHAIWQLGARHAIQSEDIVNALLQFRNGSTGTVQAATAFWPGQPERIEIHGTKGTAVIAGDQLASWQVEADEADARHPPPRAQPVASGSSDPMAISLTAFERQFLDFADAIRQRRRPLVDGREGLRALDLVLGIYESCRTAARVTIEDISTEGLSGERP